MPSVIQELIGEDVTLDYAHVHERVEDWRNRLSRLYADVTSWLPGHTTDASASVEMHEEMMREYGVASVNLPILQISNGEAKVATMIPGGLWIIGANGRVDLVARQGNFIIVDRAEYYSPSQWEIAPSLDRGHVEQLTRETLLDAIR